MKFCALGIILLLVLPSGYSKGFFSKFMGQRRAENSDHVDVCETVRIMPRIAMAVVGGAPLKNENSAPYIAAVGERIQNGSVSWFCGGSLISSHHVLTAAHCLVSRNVSTIRLGSFSTKKRPMQNDYEVTDTIIHPEYKITQSYHDIGILKIKNVIEFDSNIKPVCLPQSGSDTYEKEKAKVIGWGAEEFGGDGTQKLQQVEVDVFSNSDCEKAYRNSTIAPKTFPKGIINQQLCAGSKKGGKDACQGDSGGPLVLTDEHGVVRQIGIVSTGAGCGFKMYPGVYTRISSYSGWIQNQIKNTQTKEPLNRPKNEHSSKENSHKENIQRPNLKDNSHSSKENSQKGNLQLPNQKETSYSSKENLQKGHIQRPNQRDTSNFSKENSHTGYSNSGNIHNGNLQLPNSKETSHFLKENPYKGNIQHSNLQETSNFSKENIRKGNLQHQNLKETSNLSKENSHTGYSNSGNIQHSNLRGTPNSSKENSYMGNTQLPKIRENFNEPRTQGTHINTRSSNDDNRKQEIHQS